MSKLTSKEPCGVLIVDKPCGVTSHDVVGRVRKLFGTRRVGHTGTLDPLASGVLVILVGSAAKAAEYLVADTKRYTAVMRLGITTDTEDISGKVVSSFEGELPSHADVLAVLPEFVGEIDQIPPMYSAIKVDGKKLYELARQGVVIEREPRKITVFSVNARPLELLTDVELCIECSSGTYIRTLCADIGSRLGCGAVMKELRRERAGGFALDAAKTLDELESMSMEGRLEALLDVESLFDTLPAVSLPDFYYTLCRNGCEIYQKKIKTDLAIGTRVRLTSPKNTFFALGEVREFDGGTAIKPIKFFTTVAE